MAMTGSVKITAEVTIDFDDDDATTQAEFLDAFRDQDWTLELNDGKLTYEVISCDEVSNDDEEESEEDPESK